MLQKVIDLVIVFFWALVEFYNRLLTLCWLLYRNLLMSLLGMVDPAATKAKP